MRSCKGPFIFITVIFVAIVSRQLTAEAGANPPQDSVLSFSTYLGGSATDSGIGIALDASGNIYVAGTTFSPDFPTPHTIPQCRPTDGPNQYPCNGVFVTKLDPTGSVLLYSTYLKPGTDPIVRGFTVDAAGNAYLTGETNNGFDAANYSDVFVIKLNASGSQTIYSITLHGSTNDYGAAIAADSAGNAYVTGNTNSLDFPTKTPIQAVNYSYGGAVRGNAFVTKLDPAGSIVWSTYLGGACADTGRGITVDSAGAVYVAGGTCSTDFPTTAGAFQTIGAGAFITKISPQGTTLVYSTYLGGAGGGTVANSIAVGGSGNAYITGAAGQSFPTANALQPHPGGGDCNGSPCGDAFVAELNATGSALVFATYLGGSGSDSGSGIAVDPQGNIYVTGTTSSANFPTVNALQPDLHGPADAFVTKLKPSGAALFYSTHWIGAGSGNSIAADASGSAYVTGSSTGDAFVAKIADTDVSRPLGIIARRTVIMAQISRLTLRLRQWHLNSTSMKLHSADFWVAPLALRHKLLSYNGLVNK